ADTATVFVSVTNRAPVAANDATSAAADTPVTKNVLANDSDPEGQTLTIISWTNGANGTVVCSTPNCTYTPNAGFSGSDTFSYTIQDSLGATAVGAVSVNVAAPNQPPTAVDDTLSVAPGGSATINVLANDSDPDGDPIFLFAHGAASQGTVSCSASGNCTYTANAGATGSDAFSYTVKDSKGAAVNGTVFINFAISCPAAPSLGFPGDGATNVPTSGTMDFTGDGDLFEVFYGPAGQGGCSMSQASTPQHSFSYFNLQQDTEYEWRVVASRSGCPSVSSPCNRFRTMKTCTAAAPTPLTPAAGVTASSPITFTWTPVAGATQYKVFATSGGPDVEVGRTSGTSLRGSLPDGASSWYVVALGVPGCGDLRSPSVSFLICNAPEPPIASVIGEATSGQTYTVQWAPVTGASRYEVLEATNPGFSDAQAFPTSSTSMTFTKQNIDRPTGFYYQVRAFSDCFNGFGGASPTIRVVVVPIPPRESPNTNANAPVGSNTKIIVKVFIPGEPGQTFHFTATGDQPWMVVRPESGLLPPEGFTFDVEIDPRDLPNGTFSGTVIVTLGEVSGSRVVTNSNHTKSSTVSINLVTPVVPLSPGPPTANSLIIPAVGHLDGADARWRSDIRIANTSTALMRYLVTFTPGNPAQGVKQTSIEVGPGTTTALDDIVRAWYGIGSLGESSNGVLEVRPLTTGGNATVHGDGSPNVSLATVVSSRTYAQTQNGTLGEFIPGVLFSRFVGTGENGSPVLNLQQIAQNQLYRTNVGVVEASGKSVSTVLSVFNSAGDKLQDIPVDLEPNEQKQLNALLAQHNITLNDGRIEVKVTGGEGRVTAYAAVIDNRTKDQLFVPASTLGVTTSSKYVMPGIADLNAGQALWRSDMRVFNNGSSPQPVDLTLFQQNNAGPPLTASITVDPGETEVLDNIVRTLFGASNVGGAVHVTTANPSSLVVTARTYNQTPNGTLGLFIPAVTPDEAVGSSDRALNLLQAEDSIRYRTNVGIAEVTGNPVTVEVLVHLSNSKVTPRIEIPLAANEFRQIGILRELGIGNVYNARLSMRVIGGEGKITAYGSVIDMKTNDSTYVPAQ
ncbi:MAG TPA: cadherin-like domain-containing protein, partial [Thermoanaerobaculia bacterium]|nr:cadherin-like domain-containing protein [Thermoanaerobaculia bacterium]